MRKRFSTPEAAIFIFGESTPQRIKQVRRLVRDKKLPAVKVGRELRFEARDLKQHLLKTNKLWMN